MQLRDALRQMHGGSAGDALAAAFALAPAQADAVLRAVAPRFAWALETLSLSRGGLADLIEAVGRVDGAPYLTSGNLFLDEAARAEGERLLGLLARNGSRAMLATDMARQTRLSDAQVAAMLPGLAVATLAQLAARTRGSLGALLARMPSLGPWSKGSPHADLADILRRGCGAGPYGKRKLPRVVRRDLMGANRFGNSGPIGWYVRFMLLRPLAWLAAPMLSAGQRR